MKDFTILYTEDEDGARESLSEFLSNFTNNLFLAKDGKEGLELYLSNKTDIVISDIKMPIMTGIEMVRHIKDINPEQHIILITAHSENKYMRDAIDIKIHSYLLKPIDLDELENKINDIIKIKNLKDKLSTREIKPPHTVEREDIVAILDDEQNIINVNNNFLSFFNLKKNIDFYSKYEFFHSIFIEQDGCFHIRNETSWISNFMRIKDNKRKVFALFDELNDDIQLVIANIYYIENTSNINVSFKKINSLDVLNNIKENSYTPMSEEDKQNTKNIMVKHLNNVKSSISIIDIIVSNINNEVLGEILNKIKKQIRHTNMIKRYELNKFYLIILDASSDNIHKIKNRIMNKIKNIDKEININTINIDNKESIHNLYI